MEVDAYCFCYSELLSLSEFQKKASRPTVTMIQEVNFVRFSYAEKNNMDG
jgi:hypothetical protein